MLIHLHLTVAPYVQTTLDELGVGLDGPPFHFIFLLTYSEGSCPIPACSRFHSIVYHELMVLHDTCVTPGPAVLAEHGLHHIASSHLDQLSNLIYAVSDASTTRTSSSYLVQES